MLFKKLILGALGTNVYIFGSSETKEVVIIDPGGEPDVITKTIEEFEATPIAVLLTHGHFDHTMVAKKILRIFKIPLIFHKDEFDSGIYNRKAADRWIKEGDTIEIGEISLHVLDTPGHSPGSVSYYTKDIKDFNGTKIDGIIFTGDLLFRRSIGRSDVPGGNQNTLFNSIRHKIMYNPDITDNFLVFPGHMGNTSVGEERKLNMFKRGFL